MRALMARHARGLLADGHVEEAADHLLAAGEPREAEPVVEAARPASSPGAATGRRRSPGARPSARRRSRAARASGLQLRSLLMSRRQDDLDALVEAMRRDGELDRLMADAPDVAGWAVWALHGDGWWRSLLDLPLPPGSSRRARVMRYILEVGTGRGSAAGVGPGGPRPPPAAAHRPSSRRSTTAGASPMWSGWLGRRRSRPRDRDAGGDLPGGRAARAGRAGDARAALDATAPRIRASRYIEFWQQVEAELVFAEGDRDAALRLIRDGAAHVP